ncbi:hypothetical protein M378DRAFT_166505 [Amanita muscaria Koide BX008]|uniref:Uncharacterized protein n=1 Tax=Amanita muscaria (strain Koide BX008) TaxID=946122 RepID=A0A0C2WJL2_AMAMK|nr:hypothetical protein M378DRAFT_166505 [Amanita muscaria Koide BX008]
MLSISSCSYVAKGPDLQGQPRNVMQTRLITESASSKSKDETNLQYKAARVR